MRSNNKGHGERRQNETIKNALITLIVAFVVGISSSYMGVVVATSVLETKIIYIESSVSSITAIAKQISINHTELEKRSVWIKHIDREIKQLKEAHKKNR